MTKSTDWSQEEIEYVIKNIGKKSWKELGDYIGRTEKAVMIKASRLGFKSEPKYRFNSEFFDCIDSEEKAYWLGFAYADGYISGKYDFGIELKASDANHLRKFNKAIQGNFEVSYRDKTLKGYNKTHKMSLLRIYSKYFVDSLIIKGVTHRKSKTIVFPDLQNSLVRHFVRGYFDGDGSISIDERSQQLRCNFTSGSKVFLSKIKEILDLYKISCSLDNDREIFRIAIYGKTSTKKFLDYMYSDATVLLDRKYNFYFANKDLLNYINEGWD